MAPTREDDLDWLYGRDRKPAPEPEQTQFLAPDQSVQRAPGPATVSQPVVPPGGQDSPGRPGAPPARPGKRRHPVRTSLAILGALLLLAVVGLVAVPVYAWNQVQRVDDAPAGARPAGQPGTTFLLVGSDSRQGLSKAERKKLGTGSAAGQRTDTVIIVYVPRSGKPAMISLPRDSYLPLPGHGRNKLNTAFAFGGPRLLVQTVEQQTGLRLDGYVEVGFGGFVNVIDSLGGINLCLPKAIKDKDSHIDLPRGCQTLTGTNALGYVRMRKADPRGDLGRVERQRAMLAAVAKKSASPASVLNPVRYWRLSNAAARSVRIGQETSFLNVVTLALAMKKISGDQGLTLTVPISNPNASTPSGSSVLWDEAQAKDLFAQIARGDTSGLGKYAK